MSGRGQPARPVSEGDSPRRESAEGRAAISRPDGAAALGSGALLLATNNPAKAGELRALLDGIPLQLRTPDELGLRLEVPEEGATLEENARAKALAFALASGLPALADDSGLEVDALGGAPGVLAKRFFGTGLSDEERNRLLLERLAGVPPAARTARFVAVLALATPAGPIACCRGVLEGRVAFSPRGQGGFGYDPIFEIPALGRTVAELTLEEKNGISHRAQAARQMRELLAALALGES